MKPTKQVIDAANEIKSHELTSSEEAILLAISNKETQALLMKLVRGNQKFISTQQAIIDEFESRKTYVRRYRLRVEKLRSLGVPHHKATRQAKQELKDVQPASIY